MEIYGSVEDDDDQYFHIYHNTVYDIFGAGDKWYAGQNFLFLVDVSTYAQNNNTVLNNIFSGAEPTTGYDYMVYRTTWKWKDNTS